MTYTHQGASFTDEAYPRTVRREPSGWVGFVCFGGVMMLLLGGFQLIQGFVALLKDDYYLVTHNGLLVNVDYTAWGWTHLAIGAVAMAAGIGVIAGQVWARVIGVLVALASAVVNVAFLAAYPLWSAVVITVDVLVIYALVAHGDEVKSV